MREQNYNKALGFVLLLLLSLLAAAALFYRGDLLKQKIAEMQGQNKELKKQNEQLQLQINRLNLTIDSTNKKLVVLYDQDNQLKNEYESNKKSISNLSSQYEKTNTFSRNYNADSIRIYFTDL